MKLPGAVIDARGHLQKHHQILRTQIEPPVPVPTGPKQGNWELTPVDPRCFATAPMTEPTMSLKPTKTSASPPAQAAKLVARKRRPRPAIEHEDDDWMPRPAAITPARVASEFFENDYDVM
jgi:hypothetical protein